MWNNDDKEIIVTTSFGQRYDSPIIPRKKFKFSGKERINLIIAVSILTIAFALALSGGIGNIDEDFPITLIAAFGAVTTGFLVHELGHKFFAQKYGFWAEFNYSTNGLMLALVTGVMGFLVAAPGAVYVYGHPTKKENGKISAAGPLMNIIIGAILLPFIFILPETFEYIFKIIVAINFVLAGFNMIPVGLFDGSKILKWNIGIYMLMWLPILIVAVLYFSSFFD